jgi:cell division protein FtsZ
MLASELRGVEFIIANTDAQALSRASELIRRVQLGEKLTKGLGAGANPQIGRDAATESLAAIKEVIGDAEMLFVTAGMGGGTGTGAASVVAQTAKEQGILTVGVVTRPFLYEGDKRRKTAEEGIAELRQHVDSLIIIPNDRLLTLGPKNAKLKDMFKKADDVLDAAVRGISDLITLPGYINLDFADVDTAMADSGYALMGAGRATGEGRAIEAAKMAISSPLLEEVSIAGARAVLINVTATPDIGMDEYSEAMYLIQEAARGEHGDGQIFAGLVFDENAGEEVRITVIATGIDSAGGQIVQTPSGARVHTLRGGSAQPAAPGGQAAKSPQGEEKVSRRHYSGTPASDELPAYLRNKDAARQRVAHTPGQEEHCFDSEELELPTFIRHQAN